MATAVYTSKDRVIDVTDEGAFMVIFPYDPKLNNALQAFVPSRRYQAQPFKHYLVQPSPATCEELIRYAKEFGFSATNAARKRMIEIRSEAKESATLARALDAEVEEIPGLGGELRPFQRVAVAYGIRTQRCFFADDPGLGKTVELLATAKALDAFPLIVLTLASATIGWEREVKRWLPGMSVAIVDGDNRQYFAQVLILSYGILRQFQKDRNGQPVLNTQGRHVFEHVEFLRRRNPKMIAFDESHVLRNPKALQTQAAHQLSRGITYRFNLTGTPIVNRPLELLSQLRLLDRLEDMGGYEKYVQRYCAGVQKQIKGKVFWDATGRSNLTELNERLHQTCMVRRRKKEVLTELPPIQRAIVPLQLSNRGEYEAARRDVITWLGEQAANEQMFLNGLEGLDGEAREMKIWEHRVGVEAQARKAAELRRIGTLIQLTGRGKLEAVFEWVENFLESGEKLILYAYHREMQQALVAHFPGCAHIFGDENPGQRQANVDRFQEDEECKLIVCSLEAANSNWTLTAASNVAFAQLGWTPAIHHQAESRCYGRINDIHGANAWYLMADRTVEEYMAQLIKEKNEAVTQVADGAIDADLLPEAKAWLLS